MAKRKKLPSSKRSASINRFKSLGTLKTKTQNLRLKKRYEKSVLFAQNKPFLSFFIALGILFLIIFLGSTIFKVRTPKIEERSKAKNVSVYRIGASPRISVQGEVKKGGVIKIVATTPGIVNSINIVEGAWVEKGKILVNLASNYQGGNAFTLQRQLAGAAYQNTKDSYVIQKELIQRQRDLANQQSNNAEELRKITKASVEETQSLINLNSELINPIKAELVNLNNTNGDPARIAELMSLQAQLQGGLNQLQAAVRANSYSIDESKPAVDLAQIGKDIALSQIDIQEKALNFSLKAAGIQLKLAQVQEATMYPASPFAATVQKIHVKVGDAVNPGMPLVTIAGDAGDIIVDARVPKDAADKISKVESATIMLADREILLTPSYISSEATSGQLYSVLFNIPQEYRTSLTDSAFVTVSLPIGQTIGSIIPFIPVDSVFQTQNEAIVFVVENGKAKSKKVVLGPVTGGYVTVEKGLSSKDMVILNRTVIEGDKVAVTN